MKHLLLGMAALLFIPAATRAQNPLPEAAAGAAPLVIGETFTVDSKILGAFEKKSRQTRDSDLALARERLQQVEILRREERRSR